MAKTTFFKDFKAFISKGNVIDMAVGVVIGGSFGKIVTGLVNYIINPFIAIFVKSGSLDSVKTVITEAVLDETGAEVTAEVAILWGTWLQTILDFFITALCIFLILRVILNARKKMDAKKIAEEEAKAAAAKAEEEAAAKAAEEAAAALALREAETAASVARQEELLKEIRDLLKKA